MNRHAITEIMFQYQYKFSAEIIDYEKVYIDAYHNSEIAEKVWTDIKKWLEERPTILEDPLTFGRLKLIINSLRENVLGLESMFTKIFTDLDLPVYGSIDHLDFNALARKVGDGPQDAFLLFNRGAFTFSEVITKIVVKLFETDAGGFFGTSHKKIMHNIKEVRNVFTDLIHSYLSYKRPLKNRLVVDDISDLLVQVFDMVLVGHEISHVKLGHMFCGESAYNNNIGSLVIDKKDFKDEFEADLIGAFLTIENLRKRGYDDFVPFIGIATFFLSLSSLEIIYKWVFGEDSHMETHPPAHQRWLNVHEHFYKHKKSNVEVFEYAFGALIDECQDDIYALLKQGAYWASQDS